MTRQFLAASLLFAVLAASGCREGRPLSGGVVAHDSAGVHIVLSTAPGWTRDSAWMVADTPFFDVGGKPGTDFANIVSVVRTPAGALAVADGGDQRIRVFNGAGSVLRILGAPGFPPTSKNGVSATIQAESRVQPG